VPNDVAHLPDAKPIVYLNLKSMLQEKYGNSHGHTGDGEEPIRAQRPRLDYGLHDRIRLAGKDLRLGVLIPGRRVNGSRRFYFAVPLTSC